MESLTATLRLYSKVGINETPMALSLCGDSLTSKPDSNIFTAISESFFALTSLSIRHKIHF